MTAVVTGPDGRTERTHGQVHRRRGLFARWSDDLTLGVRLTFGGGRTSWIRLGMTALGVGLGVALLLVAASVPTMLQARRDRGLARDFRPFSTEQIRPGDNTLLVASIDDEYRDLPIRGQLLQPEGPRAPHPPGLAALPGPGEMVVSPALGRLLATPEGALLRTRLNHRVAGTIGPDGLAGPNEYAFYLGTDQLTAEPDRAVYRIDHYGAEEERRTLDPVLMLLVVVIVVVLLLPIAVFIAAAVRFGGEARDRRLAALRLVGADSAMARRIAAGEALAGAVLGLAVGAAVFLGGRQLIETLTLWDISVFATDVSPSAPIAALIALAVPASAVMVALVALRRIVVEPLGVVRRAGGRRRRLVWRLALPVIGAALLLPLVGSISKKGQGFNVYQAVGGVALLLIGVAVLLPWLVEAAVRRLGGGSVSWQLAVRRLQLDNGTSVRVVSGIAVAVAGAIALQTLFAGAQGNYSVATGQDTNRADIQADLDNGVTHTPTQEIAARFRRTDGVRSVLAYSVSAVAPPGTEDYTTLFVGDCATLSEIAEINQCADGAVYLVGDDTQPDAGTARAPAPGQRLEVGYRRKDDTAAHPQWTIPAGAVAAKSRTDPSGGRRTGVFATPAAVGASVIGQAQTQLYLKLDPARPDAAEHVRNTAAAVSPLMTVTRMAARSQDRTFTSIQRGLFAGALGTLLLIGAGLLVTVLEQLRERRRLLAVLVAFGTRRGIICRSVLWQAAIPVTLGLLLAIAAGTALGRLLLAMASEPGHLDWPGILAVSGAGAAVVLLVTVLSMPAVWRMMRPEGLRTE